MEYQAMATSYGSPGGQQPCQRRVVEHVDAVVAKVLWEKRRDSHSLDGIRQAAKAREDLDEDEPVAGGSLVRERGAW